MNTDIAGVRCTVSRSGYTGEDGFEIAMGASEARYVAEVLLHRDEVESIGLGARDSLRLEAGLPLYGHDLGPATNPVEAGLSWSIGKARRPGGSRAGGYLGAAAIDAMLSGGPPRRRIGLRPGGRAPVREGAEVHVGDRAVGTVTSGGFGPSVGAPIAMAYVETGSLSETLTAQVRGKALPVEVTKLPFVTPRYQR